MTSPVGSSEGNAPPSRPAGPSLADYEVLEKVGQGAQGVVFRGVHKATGLVVALKQIDVSCLNNKERVSVLAEVKVLATIAETPHPCVMTYQESFVDQGSLWIVLEWSANGTLQDAFSTVQRKRRTEFEEDEIWNVFLSLALALDHVHQLHILHRDVKMANVFLHYPEGTNPLALGRALPRVQLGDFGVSTILDDRSRALTMVGTPYYLSPELCMGKAYSSKSDVWSLGVLLFVLLNQKMPYEASNYAALILRIVQEEHAKHHPASSKFSIGLRRMATWCLQKEERNRPTARELLLHSDCMKRMVRLGLPIPPSLMEAACFEPAPVATKALAKTSLDGPQRTGGHQTGGTAATAAGGRPLPLKRSGIPPAGGAAAVASRRRVRVVQGVSNQPKTPITPPTPVVVGRTTSAGSLRGQKAGGQPPATVGPKASVLGVMSRGVGGPTDAPPPAPSPTLPAHHVLRSKRDVAAVRSLPAYDDSGPNSSEDEGMQRRGVGQSPLQGPSAPRRSGDGGRLHSYEKQILRSDPDRARVLLASSSAYDGAPPQQPAIAGRIGAGDATAGSGNSREYLHHVRSWNEDNRPATRGDTSATTIALLRKHDLAPEGLMEDAVLQGSMSPSVAGRAHGHYESATVVIDQRGGPSWQSVAHQKQGAVAELGGNTTWQPAVHADVTQVLHSTTQSSIPDETSGASTSRRDEQRRLRASIPEEVSCRQEEGDDENVYAGDTFVCDDDDDDGLVVCEARCDDRQGGDVEVEGWGDVPVDPDDVEDGVEPSWMQGDEDIESSADDNADAGVQSLRMLPPGSVVWRVDGEGGSSAAVPQTQQSSHRDASDGGDANRVVSPAREDPPTEFLDNTSDVAEQAHDLFSAGEALVGERGFAEVVEVLTRDAPLSSAALQSFIQERARSPADVPELMYLCFRYVMLVGELQRMRRDGA